MSNDLFFRTGTPFTGTPKTDAKGRLYTVVSTQCRRCGGAGRSDKWAHTGYVCYDCNGSCRGPDRDMLLYTADRLATLNATRDKRHATKAAKAAVVRATAQAQATANREAFQAEFADVLPWLSHAGCSPLEGEGTGDEIAYRDGFLGDMLRAAHTRATWTPAQATAIRAAYARSLEDKRKRAASQHVGIIGGRIETSVTVERVNSYDRPQFGASWLSETVYIITMRDAEGNALISKSSRFYAEKGQQFSIKATVKDHNDYQGEMQTLLQRIKITSEIAKPDTATPQ